MRPPTHAAVTAATGTIAPRPTGGGRRAGCGPRTGTPPPFQKE